MSNFIIPITSYIILIPEEPSGPLLICFEKRLPKRSERIIVYKVKDTINSPLETSYCLLTISSSVWSFDLHASQADTTNISLHHFCVGVMDIYVPLSVCAIEHKNLTGLVTSQIVLLELRIRFFQLDFNWPTVSCCKVKVKLAESLFKPSSSRFRIAYSTDFFKCYNKS